jgi:predicted nucleic acid-binding protein
VGLTVLDAGVLIGFLDAQDAHHDAAHSALAKAREHRQRLAMPASALTEALVGPARLGTEAVIEVQDFLERLPIEVTELTQPIAVAAAELRARHGGRLKLPDALVVATARTLEADVLVTTDRNWPTGRAMGLAATLVEL